jgi:hypothetical protein
VRHGEESVLRSPQAIFKFDWVWFSRKMLIQRCVDTEHWCLSILSAMAMGEILRLNCMTMEGLVRVDPDFMALFHTDSI